MAEVLKKLGAVFLDIFQTVVLALSIFVISYLFLFAPHQVKGGSMLPNFHNGEFLLTDKLTYRLRSPVRGEVVVFKAPPSEACVEIECEYIKRVVGLPGEKIKIENGRIYINEQLLIEPYVGDDIRTQAGGILREGVDVVVPQDDFLVLGDNRPHSRDGREFGPIKKEAIVGRAFIRYWPFNRLGKIPAVHYEL